MDKLDKLILEIENFNLPKAEKEPANRHFELRPYQWLLRNLVGGIGTLFIRSILYEANINEHHIFRWRLENKYIQYLILNHYNPGCMPQTISLSELKNGINGIKKIKTLFEKGFFLKATLSECTGKTGTFDRTAEFEQIIHLPQSKYHGNQNEEWILQKKLNLQAEFRIHSFNDDIIYGLTFKVIGLLTLDNYNAERFVKKILDNLPVTISQGSLIAWDIGLTQDDQYYVIESNFTGFHPKFNYGFQTSGYFQDAPYGPISCAWLNMYIKNKYGFSITKVDSSLGGIHFFSAFTFYLSLFKSEHFKALENKTENCPLFAIMYINENSNPLLISLIEYLQRAKYAERYYIITTQLFFEEIIHVFNGYKNITFFQETKLFTKEQYRLITQLSYERRKQISCQLTLRILNKDNCVII